MTDKIKSKIIEAVPEIIELKFGCKIISEVWGELVIRGKGARGRKDTEDTYEAIDEGFIKSNSVGSCFVPESSIKEILGRPITLADVLRAISTSFDEGNIEAGSWGVAVDGSFFRAYRRYEKWNLTADYDGQSDEVKSFIGKLLGV